MVRTRQSYEYESKSMVQYILEGHSLSETAREFDLDIYTVKRRLRSIGYTYADLVEEREKRKQKGS